MAYYYSPFRKNYKCKKADAGCPFCNEKLMTEQSVHYASGEIVENDYYRWVVNFFPKFEGHTMIIPKKHLEKLGTESAKETKAREELTGLAAATLEKLYPGAGIEIFLQFGESSESSIKHLHWHIVPAQKNDPLRSFDKLGQFYTIEAETPKLLIFPIPIQRALKPLLSALAKKLGRKE